MKKTLTIPVSRALLVDSYVDVRSIVSSQALRSGLALRWLVTDISGPHDYMNTPGDLSSGVVCYHVTMQCDETIEICICGVKVSMTVDEIETFIYNAATLVAKFETTDDPLSLNERLHGEAEDMAGVFSSLGYDKIVEAVKKELFPEEGEEDISWTEEGGEHE